MFKQSHSELYMLIGLGCLRQSYTTSQRPQIPRMTPQQNPSSQGVLMGSSAAFSARIQKTQKGQTVAIFYCLNLSILPLLS